MSHATICANIKQHIREINNNYQLFNNFSMQDINVFIIFEKLIEYNDAITTQRRIIFYTDKILNNADKIVPFQEYNFYLFSELKGLVFEITNCIMLDINQASICLTNHLLERTMKLSLIKYDMGKIKIGNPEFVNKIHSAYIKYDNLLLWETIKLAYEKEIINEGRTKLIEKLKRQIQKPFLSCQFNKNTSSKTCQRIFHRLQMQYRRRY